MEDASLRARAADRWNIVDRGRGISETIRRRRKAGRIAHGGALDRRLRTVKKRIEHLRIEAAGSCLLGRQAVMSPHRFRLRLRKMRQPLMASAGGDHAEARGARPIDEVANQRRLVSESEAVNDARLRSFSRQQRTTESIGL